MKTDKITLKNKQAWITFKSKEGEYMGTLHLVSDEFVDEVMSSKEQELKMNEIILDRKLYVRWSKACYMAGVNGVSFEKIMEEADKMLFKKVPKKQGEKTK